MTWDVDILYLEDSAEDAELVQAALLDSGINGRVVVVSTRDEFVRSLTGGKVDLVLSDYNLPSFDGQSALALVRERKPHLPFIFVSGTIGEVRAVEILKKGATDYVLKDNLTKLPMAVRRAIEEARERVRSAEAEEKLRRSDERFRLVMQATTDTLYDWTFATGHIWWNENLYTMFAFRPQDVEQTLDWWTRHIHEEDRPRVLASIDDSLERKQHRWSGDYRFVKGDGTHAEVLDRAYVVYGPDGKPTRLVGSMMDVTEFKGLQRQFLQAQKMEAVGRLAGGVAHDFNNLLTVINGYSELILAKMPAQHPDRADLEEVLGAGRRAGGLTRQLLAFSRKQVIQAVSVSLNEVLLGLEKMLNRLLGADVKLVLTPAADLGRVFADPGQLEQVIVNLVVNARDAMPQGGKITLRTSNIDLDGAGSHVLLEVSDTGTGISPEVRAHLFEPFFTTKETGKGTGLGLSTVHGIVAQSGGTIKVESVVGRGTTFLIYLPHSDKGTEARPRVAATTEERAGSETVLVAEDQESVRKLAVSILQAKGYSVLQAADGTEALKVCESHDGPIHLLLTDLVMRALSGGELAKMVRRIHPETRVLFMSGYTDREAGDRELLKEGIEFLEKPFTVEGLVQKVRQVLVS